MAYTPTVWKNGEFPPIDAEHLNKIEQGIANSAPGGFGLGVAGGQSLSATDDLDTVTKNGVYQWSSSLPKNAPTGYCKMRVWNGADWISQEIMSAYANEKDSIRRRVFNNNVWGPFEWVNPPMALGVEYRTTERYMGKPVYAQLIDCGYGPNNSNAHATKAIENIDTIVRWSGTSSDGSAFPFANHMYSPAHILNGIVYKSSNVLHIDLYSNENKSGVTLYVSVFYTKNPDQ